jgi:hypothetical protein
LRKVVAAVATTGISGMLLSRLTEPAFADNIVPPSGAATFDGPVGIGTTNPKALLQVYNGGDIGSSVPTSFAIALSGPSPNNRIIICDGNKTFYFGAQASGNGQAELSTYDYANARGMDLLFNGNGGNVLFYGSNTNVGIGTNMPQYKLTVAGNAGQSIVAANGFVKAAVLVNGGPPSIIRSFNNLPGGSAPTVSKPFGVGTYEVNFGVNIAQRFFLATLLGSNSTDQGGAVDGQILASTRDGNPNAVYVKTNDSTGTTSDRSFYLMVC